MFENDADCPRLMKPLIQALRLSKAVTLGSDYPKFLVDWFQADVNYLYLTMPNFGLIPTINKNA